MKGLKDEQNIRNMHYGINAEKLTVVNKELQNERSKNHKLKSILSQNTQMLQNDLVKLFERNDMRYFWIFKTVDNLFT